MTEKAVMRRLSGLRVALLASASIVLSTAAGCALAAVEANVTARIEKYADGRQDVSLVITQGEKHSQFGVTAALAAVDAVRSCARGYVAVARDAYGEIVIGLDDDRQEANFELRSAGVVIVAEGLFVLPFRPVSAPAPGHARIDYFPLIDLCGLDTRENTRVSALTEGWGLRWRYGRIRPWPLIGQRSFWW
jgi:hypothetical protein